ncbi:MAG: hypothetical protein M1421_05565 [Candidatus Eremiobacteraeota bacterium]|jgi:formate-dependent nitrite reductase membrane component NrfD|nr:hypothetical protein [Candidatus Eremiobacteraeota bacterium]
MEKFIILHRFQILFCWSSLCYFLIYYSQWKNRYWRILAIPFLLIGIIFLLIGSGSYFLLPKKFSLLASHFISFSYTPFSLLTIGIFSFSVLWEWGLIYLAPIMTLISKKKWKVEILEEPYTLGEIKQKERKEKAVLLAIALLLLAGTQVRGYSSNQFTGPWGIFMHFIMGFWIPLIGACIIIWSVFTKTKK